MGTVTALLDDYCATAVAWDEARGNAAKANPLFDHLQQLQKQLRAKPEGRLGIEALMAHPSVGVRLTAAAHSLQWSPDEAARVLEAIEAGPGLEAVSAKYTLKAYRNGTLNLDW
jgi:hypothetical protein